MIDETRREDDIPTADNGAQENNNAEVINENTEIESINEDQGSENLSETSSNEESVEEMPELTDKNEEPVNETEGQNAQVEKKEETYAFRWEYSEQTRNDTSRALAKKTKREKGILAYAIIMTAAFVLAFAVLAASLAFDNIENWFASSADEELSVSEIVEIGMPSTFAVFSNRGNGMGSIGSGFALTETGYIMTNYHVVENSVDVWVVDANGVEYAASVVGYDEAMDVAVLFAERAEFAPAKLGNSDEVALGETVVAIGCPNGEELMFSVSNGIVSGKDRYIDERRMLQTNAPLNPGNSGGPLFDSNGFVVGVVTSKMTYTTTESGEKIALEGIAFAIPINEVAAWAEEVVANDLERPMLGVTAVPVEAGNSYFIMDESGRRYAHYQDSNGRDWYRNENGQTVEITDELLSVEGNWIVYADVTGICITNVTKGLGADGVLKAQDIVTEVEGISVATVADVKAAINGLEPGDTISVVYYRNGQRRTATMTLKTKGDMLSAQ